MFEYNKFRFSFEGSSTEYFKIWFRNTVLLIITFGLYRPWAREIRLKYLYSNTNFAQSNFRFFGTGNEMFKGFLKALLLLFGLITIGGIISYIIFIYSFEPQMNEFEYNRYSGRFEEVLDAFTAYLLSFYIVLGVTFVLIPFSLLPLALHGRFRYLLGRSSYRGIQLHYTGKRKFMIQQFCLGIFLILITAGLAIPFLIIRIVRYIIKHIRIGDLKMEFIGSPNVLLLYFLLYLGLPILFTHLLGFFEEIKNGVAEGEFIYFLLSAFFSALSIIIFRYTVTQYLFNHITIRQGERVSNVSLSIPFLKYLGVQILNLWITIITLGFGSTLASINTMKLLRNRIVLIGTIDFNELKQEEKEDDSDSTGDQLMGFFDFDLLF